MGHQMRNLRDWLPLLMPLLVGGLEHAMQLAEAMTARGFASTRSVPGGKQVLPRLLMLVGVIMLAIGWVSQLGGAQMNGLMLIGVGGMLILGGLWYQGRQSDRTIYHRPAWGWQDILTMLCINMYPGIILTSGSWLE